MDKDEFFVMVGVTRLQVNEVNSLGPGRHWDGEAGVHPRSIKNQTAKMIVDP